MRQRVARGNDCERLYVGLRRAPVNLFKVQHLTTRQHQVFVSHGYCRPSGYKQRKIAVRTAMIMRRRRPDGRNATAGGAPKSDVVR